MRYIPISKKEYLSHLIGEEKPVYYKDFKPVKNPSFWDVTQWPERWEKGAKILEKSDVGKIVTAPVRITAAVTGATKKTVEETPDILKNLSRSIPIIAITALVIGGGFFAYKAGLFNKKEIQKLSNCH